jgi:hypothetical protein
MSGIHDPALGVLYLLISHRNKIHLKGTKCIGILLVGGRGKRRI